MKRLGRELTAAILIDVDDDEVVHRLSGRRTCEKGGHIFHVGFDPPKEEGVCDVCGGRLVVRDDDKPEVIRHRLGQYHGKTEPLIAHYEGQAILKRGDGSQSPDEVNEKIRALLATQRTAEQA
jgi:adenylate kinase